MMNAFKPANNSADNNVYNDFIQSGYIIARQLLNPHELEERKARLSSHIDRFAQAYLEPFASSCPDIAIEQRLNMVAKNNRAYAQSLLTAVLTDSQNDALIDNLVHHHRIYPMLERLLPRHRIIGYTTRVRANISALPTFSTGWHQDLADEARPDGGCNMLRIACWIPLADVDETTGALECMAGHYPHSLMQPQPGGGYQFPQALADLAEKTVLSCKAGDVVLMDRFLPHRSLPVKSGLSRWSIVIWVKAEAC